MFGIWSIPEVTHALAESLRAHAEALDTENAVRGLDAMREVEFHPVLGCGIAQAGFDAWRELPYPSFVGPTSRAGNTQDPLPRDRERCDLVIAPAGSGTPADPVSLAIERRAASDTLFESHVAADQSLDASPAPEDLFWLEVKLVGQFAVVDGGEQANGQYSTELVRAGRDLEKLACDPLIAFGGLLLIQLTADRETAEHDREMALNRWLDHGWPVRTPEVEGFEISDRVGNRWCSLMLTPVR